MLQIFQSLQRVKITALIIGESGSGKSSVIELFHHWSKHKEQANLDQVKRIINQKNEANTMNRSISQTRKPQTYYLSFRSGNVIYELVLIDTPGLGDVKGLDQDDSNVDLILKEMSESSVSSLNAILLVLNGSNSRVSNKTKYILQKLYSLCPVTFYDKLYLLLTNTQLESNFDWKENISISMKEENVFTIDNLMFSSFDYRNLNPKITIKLSNNYRECIETLSLMFDQWKKTGGSSLDDFRELKSSRDGLRYNIQTILGIMNSVNRNKQEIERIKAVVEQNISIKEVLEKINKQKVIKYDVEKVDTSYHNTICIKCKKICHEKCSLGFTQVAGHNIFKNCACMKDDTCGECKCSHTEHVHCKFVLKRITTETPLITQQQSEVLKKVTDEATQKKMTIRVLDDQINKMNSNLEEHKKELGGFLKSMSDIVPNYDYIIEIKYAIKTIEDDLMVETDVVKIDQLQNSKQYLTKLILEYETAVTSVNPERREKIKSIYQILDSTLVSMDIVKHQLIQTLAYPVLYDLNKHGKVQAETRDLLKALFFIGPPGTAKTTVARLTAKILHKMGFLSSDKFVEVDRSKLIGKYIGHTAPQTREVIDSARNGVLFIDEAYSLCNKGEKDFGSECIEILMTEMTSGREDSPVIIFAGYNKELLEELMQSNPGFKSRVKKIIRFKSLSPRDMTDIFKLLVDNYNKKEEIIYESKAQDLLTTNMLQLDTKITENYNGRIPERLFTTALQIAKENVVQNGYEKLEIGPKVIIQAFNDLVNWMKQGADIIDD